MVEVFAVRAPTAVNDLQAQAQQSAQMKPVYDKRVAAATSFQELLLQSRGILLVIWR